MKLRFRDNSLRLRVNQREVERLSDGSALEQQIQFPNGAAISYVLEPSPRAAADASFEHGVIRISAPRELVHDWAKSATIGIYFELPANDTFLRVAIEKDLDCKDAPPAERDPFAFPRN